MVYLRVPWAFLEPDEGEFNWALLDTPAQRWIAKGKKIAIRVSCSESWWRYATPKWVQDAGAKGIEFEFGKGPQPARRAALGTRLPGPGISGEARSLPGGHGQPLRRQP